MRDAQTAEVAGRQYNRIARRQLTDLGWSNRAISHAVRTSRLVIVEQGVFAIAPLLKHDKWGRWMGATLTASGTVLSHECAAVAWNALSREPAW